MTRVGRLQRRAGAICSRLARTRGNVNSWRLLSRIRCIHDQFTMDSCSSFSIIELTCLQFSTVSPRAGWRPERQVPDCLGSWVE